MDRLYKAVYEKVSEGGKFQRALFNYAYQYKKNKYEAGYETPLIDRYFISGYETPVTPFIDRYFTAGYDTSLIDRYVISGYGTPVTPFIGRYFTAGYDTSLIHRFFISGYETPLIHRYFILHGSKFIANKKQYFLTFLWNSTTH